jgi:hypothetical protein
MAAKSQSDSELWIKLQVHGTSTSKTGVDQASAEAYNLIAANGTATPNKAGVNQTIAEEYHKLSGS